MKTDLIQGIIIRDDPFQLETPSTKYQLTKLLVGQGYVKLLNKIAYYHNPGAKQPAARIGLVQKNEQGDLLARLRPRK